MAKIAVRIAGAVSCMIALAGCGAGRIEKWEEATGHRNQTLRRGDDLLGVTVPVLRAPGLERVWGAPMIQRDGEGGYCLTYADPTRPLRKLKVHGMAEALPKLSSPPTIGGEKMLNNTLTDYEREQAWRKVEVLGEKVRWFQQSAGGGAEGAYFSTEGFSLKSPGGRKGYYRLVAENGDAAGEEVVRWFASVGF
ncbi:hypothetical protein [Luteolibacter marinus]|uniref:hypothetical protein n=1 Tax=Luteolibacter marinus TaxID=2776705 RepID=UPI0018673C6C|nr:hypothetical protein [Luteolibacter marinus]